MKHRKPTRRQQSQHWKPTGRQGRSVRGEMMTTDKEKKAIKFLEDNDIFPYDFGDEMAPDNEDFYQEEDVYKALALARQDERKKIRARVEPSIQELFSCSVCGKEDDTGGFEKPRRFCPYCLSLEIEKGKLQGEKDEREKCDKEVAGMTCACDDDANQICGFHRNKEKEQFEKGEQAGREEVKSGMEKEKLYCSECDCVYIKLNGDENDKGVCPYSFCPSNTDKDKRIASLESEVKALKETAGSATQSVIIPELEAQMAFEIPLMLDVLRDRCNKYEIALEKILKDHHLCGCDEIAKQALKKERK
jgi:hypothetical protein